MEGEINVVLPEMVKVEKLTVRPKDVLVVTVPASYNTKESVMQINNLRIVLEEKFNVRVLMVPEGTEIQKIIRGTSNDI